MSDFLNEVMNCRSITAATRVGNHVMCMIERNGRRMHFLATDENDWHGVLTVQYQRTIAGEQSDAVQSLLRAIEPMPLPTLLRLEYHEVTRQVRAVMRWPLHEAYRPGDDAASAVRILFDCWTVIEPIILRASEGDDIDTLAAEANRQLDALFPKRRSQAAA